MARWIGFDDDESIPEVTSPVKPLTAGSQAQTSAPAAAPSAPSSEPPAADGLLDFLSGRSGHMHVHHDDPPKPMRLSPETKPKHRHHHHHSSKQHGRSARRASMTDVKSLASHLDQWGADLGEHPHTPFGAAAAAAASSSKPAGGAPAAAAATAQKAESPRIRQTQRLYDWANDDEPNDDDEAAESKPVSLHHEDKDAASARGGFPGGGDKAKGPMSPISLEQAAAAALARQPAKEGATAASGGAAQPQPPVRRHSVHGNEQFMMIDALPLLSTGAVFTKHGRHGKPHLRRLWLDKNELIRWYSPVKDQWECEIPVQNIDRILLGKQTDVFRRDNGKYARDIASERCFSLVYHGTGTGNHTLDLVAESRAQREIWSLGLLFLARAARKGTPPEDLLEVPVEIHKDEELQRSLRKKTYHFAPIQVPEDFKLDAMMHKKQEEGGAAAASAADESDSGGATTKNFV